MAAVAKGRFGLGPGLLQCHLQHQLVQRHPHPAPAAAGRRFDQHRKTDLAGQSHRGRLVVDQPVASWHDGHFGFAGELPRRVFVTQAGHGLRRGADEVDLAVAADLVEVGVFGEETVAGMNGLHVADLGGTDHPIDLPIAVGSFGWPDAIGFVGQFEIGRTTIRLAENGDRLDPHFPAGANDA